MRIGNSNQKSRSVVLIRVMAFAQLVYPAVVLMLVVAAGCLLTARFYNTDYTQEAEVGPEDLSVEELADRYMNARGGASLLGNVTHLHLDGFIMGDEDTRVFSAVKPRGEAARFTFLGHSQQYDVVPDAMGLRVLERNKDAAEGETLLDDSAYSLGLHLMDLLDPFSEMILSAQLNSVEIERVEQYGIETYKLSMQRKIPDLISYIYVDTETLRMISREDVYANGKVYKFKYSDFSQIDGLSFPHTIRVSHSDGPMSEIHLRSIHLNPDKNTISGHGLMADDGY